jgi:N-acetyl-1-D-myo-inositol-2-amino-2-deoxy-alpha-D-glucopyranoside deacetylase
MGQRVLFVHAHPGDETVLAGATIARLVESGSSVTVLTCTRRDDAQLPDALDVLGVTDHRFLGTSRARWEGLEPRTYSDSSGGSDRGTALATAELGEVASDIGAVILHASAEVVVTHAEGDGDPDRQRVHEAARWATDVLRVPLYVTRALDDASVVVDDAASLDRKAAAAAAHGLGSDMVGPEGFARLRTQPPQARVGLATRLVSSILALALGAFAGGVLTVIHQASTTIGDIAVPWGLIVALVLTAALLSGLRLVYETRLIPGFATIGLLGTAALLALQSAGGSVIVPDNPAGVTWTIGAVLIAAVVLAWPRVTPRKRG